MKNFTIYRNGNYDLKANASLKAEALAQTAGKIAISGLKGLAIGLLNVSEKAIKGQTLSQEALQELGF